jgi:cellobiose phosphorylase
MFALSGVVFAALGLVSAPYGRHERRGWGPSVPERLGWVLMEAPAPLLFAPPFDRSSQDPGYIKGYLPGIRENGGQYTHAALWTVMAVARLGSGDEAVELLHMLNPINHARTPGRRTLGQFFAVAADVTPTRPTGRMDMVTGSTG